jgi:hypothetical protein
VDSKTGISPINMLLTALLASLLSGRKKKEHRLFSQMGDHYLLVNRYEISIMSQMTKDMFRL